MHAGDTERFVWSIRPRDAPSDRQSVLPPDISPTANLAASLAEHRARDCGDVVTVVASRGGYVARTFAAGREKARRPGLPRVYRIWTPRFGKSTVFRRLADYTYFYVGAAYRFAALPRQDVIISLTTPPYIALVGVLHKLLHRKTKLILWNMDAYPDVLERFGGVTRGGLLSRVLRRVNRALFRAVDHLVCLDSAMQKLMCTQYVDGRNVTPCVVIPNWEDQGFFPPLDPDAPRPATFDVLYMGNLGAGHSFSTVLDAAQRLQGTNVRFVYRSGGSRVSSLKQAVRERGLSNVIVRGYVGDKERTRDALASAGCALITLRDDALGVMSPSKLHAALAMGVPILYVGPEGSNVDEAIRTFGCGLSVRQGDAASVVSFIESLRQNPAAHREMRIKARHAFLSRYSDRSAFDAFDALLAECVKARTVTDESRSNPHYGTSTVGPARAL